MTPRRSLLHGAIAGAAAGVVTLAAMYLATSVPSLLMESAIKPPPGQITIAVPFADSREGLKTVRVGLVTLVTTSVFQTFEK